MRKHMVGPSPCAEHDTEHLVFALSKPKGILQSVSKVIILLFLAVAVLLTGFLFMFIFVPIAVAYIWDDHDKIKRLEARLARLEKPTEGTKLEQA